ncbi:MAG: redoxin domain-containing protein [Planctomycetes bacterium]|nr:redoxin domain-containing protein [Planctomycetota bacterium]
MKSLRTVGWIVSLASVHFAALASVAIAGDRPGHSAHGSAFDTGLRQRPWRMEGIGRTHFAVTTKVPEVQAWFDQGNTLLHSFWFEEAERSFRWCLKLDPECAMAYWGLAATSLNWFSKPELDSPEAKRGLEFLKEAVRRKTTVSPRERTYIEAWATAFTGESLERSKVLTVELQKLVLAYPDDVEAKSLYALYGIEKDNAYGTELVIRQVLEREPDHPGAHHYRIHNWDGLATEQALASCARYGKVAPGIGHANHMPGHNYTKLGMWHEAAYSMDGATRVELRYMNERLALPFETWNYAHNRNYLCYIQEQLGLERASLEGARALLAAPRDPDRNKDDDRGAYDQGLQALVRCLIKFERWEEILRPDAIPWRDIAADKASRAFAEALAHVATGDLVEARSEIAELRTAISTQDEKQKDWDIDLALAADAAEGLLRAAEGDVLDATRLLLQAGALEQKKRDDDSYRNDPPPYPWPVLRVLGDVYLSRGEHRLAVEAYERALKVEVDDAFALSGLAQARHALGEHEAAARCAGKLAYVWSSADPGLSWQREVEALGLAAKPIAETPAPERRYRPELLNELGPASWEPFAAPKLDCLDPEGQPVRLEDFRGQNVLLVFYLNDKCVHCVEQLVSIDEHAADWRAENTVVLAVSSTPPAKNKESLKLGELSIRLLSDSDHVNARRFTSFDDFEEIELHSTILIDARGRVHWKRTGGDPFTDMDFLLAEVKRVNALGVEAQAR